jgi:hypothetical protein
MNLEEKILDVLKDTEFEEPGNHRPGYMGDILP